jgi:hypothetical protein
LGVILQFYGPKNKKQIRRMVSSGILRRMALVRTEVSEELSASFIRATRMGELEGLELEELEDAILHSHRRENFKPYKSKKTNSMPLVRKRVIPTERPPLVVEI